ncbi:DUF6090 family protein [Maribellus mangrovi]|uniref:DUF6090 family protein n=1 Tax=Maribellus mangrovi TaxID=3133146 RepID=UPI0030EBE43B
MRYKFAAENRVGKYLSYAIGEILLVVIGILIALQVNNWNEERKQHVAFKRTLEALRQDLNYNIYLANSDIIDAYNKDSIITMALNNKITRDMYRENPDFRNAINSRYFYPVQDNLSAALSFENHIPNRYMSIVPQLKLLSAQFDRWQDSYSISFETVINYNDWLTDRFSWYSRNDSLAVESNIDYLLNDPVYLNKLSFFRNNYLNNTIWNVTILRSLSAGILAKLEQIEKSEKESDINALFDQLRLKPYNHISDTTGFTTDQQVQFRTGSLIYNATNQTITVFRIIDFRRNYPRTLNPGDFYTPITNGGDLVEVVYENQDSQFYQTVIDGYLLIE